MNKGISKEEETLINWGFFGALLVSEDKEDKKDLHEVHLKKYLSAELLEDSKPESID